MVQQLQAVNCCQTGFGLWPLLPARQACKWRAGNQESPREAWPGREKAQARPALRRPGPPSTPSRTGRDPQGIPTNPRFPLTAGRDPRGFPSNSRASGREGSRPVPLGAAAELVKRRAGSGLLGWRSLRSLPLYPNILGVGRS